MPFTDEALRRASERASTLHYDAWHDPDRPPTIHYQPDDRVDPAVEPGEDVTDAFDARYEPRGWTFTAQRQVTVTHGLTRASWLKIGHAWVTELAPGEYVTFHFEREGSAVAYQF